VDLNLLTFSFVWEKQVVMNGDQTCWKEEADFSGCCNQV